MCVWGGGFSSEATPFLWGGNFLFPAWIWSWALSVSRAEEGAWEPVTPFADFQLVLLLSIQMTFFYSLVYLEFED